MPSEQSAPLREFTARRAKTHIGVIRAPGHDRHWIIATSEKPGYRTTLDYSGRWGIEPMFSDFKSRGLGVETTQIQYPDRLARLLLVMALALYSAVSIGLWDEADHPTPAGKVLKCQPAKVVRSRVSWFTRGLRRIAMLMQTLEPLPPLRISCGQR